MAELNLNKDQSENIHYNFPDFPIMAAIGRLSAYPNMASASHWHNDFEFVMAVENDIGYAVNGKEYKLIPGQGMFINSRQLHSVFSIDGQDGRYMCILIPPDMFSPAARIHSTYLEPICKDTEHCMILLTQAISWQGAILNYMNDIRKEFVNEEEGFELKVMGIAHLMLRTLYKNRNNATVMDVSLNRRAAALHQMIGYIQANYQNKISLNHIANAGNVCRSTCCEIFQSLLHTTPIIYLANYRIEKSIESLTYTNKAITEIAFECGFNGSSYYTELFHRKMGLTPTEYRNRLL